MKGILFTISNEQIKESLNKLQTKIESLETVKEVQDKIISTKDSQISFLQGEISSITNWIIFVGGVIIALASAAFIYIKLLENKAKKKIEDGEEQIALAQEKIEQAENKIQQANAITTLAQEKLTELEEKQKLLEEQANAIDNKQKLDMKFNAIKTRLDKLNVLKETYQGLISPEHKEKFDLLISKLESQEMEYRMLYSDISERIINENKITNDVLLLIDKLNSESITLTNEFLSVFGF